jgi:hypothetical protein
MHGCNLIINKDSTIKKTFSIQLSGMSVHFEPFNPSYYNKIGLMDKNNGNFF